MIWKIHENDVTRTEKEAKVVQEVLSSVQKFKTRRMQKEFVDRYQKVAKPVVLRNMFTYLTDFEYTPEDQSQREIDLRPCQFLVESENLDIVVDLRKNFGRDTKFEAFWGEMS